MTELGPWPQPPLLDPGLAGGQGALLGHHGLLQAPDGRLHLLQLHYCLGLLLLQAHLGLPHLEIMEEEKVMG